MRIGIPRETAAGETRVAATPETVKKLKAQGHTLLVESAAGLAAAVTDEAYAAAGAEIVDTRAAFGAPLVLKVRGPVNGEHALMQPGTALVGMLNPFDRPGLQALADARLTAFALEAAPRTTRAQSMDVLSSQANVAGYKAVMLAADVYQRFIPMLMTAAGTVKAARVVILGVGVAGLQAIATAKRLGAVIEASDVRPSVKEQVESLGAKFIDVPCETAEEREAAEGTGGYARELTTEEKAKQQEILDRHIAKADAVITTAAIPGRTAPRIISKSAVAAMGAGAVIVDLAAESGGNCELTVAGETVVTPNGVKILGPRNLPSELARHASQMYARNLLNFLAPAIKKGELAIDWQDEVFAQSVLTHDGQVKHAPTAKLVEAR